MIDEFFSILTALPINSTYLLQEVAELSQGLCDSSSADRAEQCFSQ